MLPFNPCKDALTERILSFLRIFGYPQPFSRIKDDSFEIERRFHFYKKYLNILYEENDSFLDHKLFLITFSKPKVEKHDPSFV